MTYKLGKRPAQQDPLGRNIKFKTILSNELPPPPPEYDVDFDDPAIWPLQLPMFANDKWGCCVIAARANQTLRFEKTEQGDALDITDSDVLKEYWTEQGDPDGTERPDDGLYILQSLKLWRSQGWEASGQRHFIDAFAEVDRSKTRQVKQAIWLLGGLQSGVMLREHDMEQLDKKKIWSVTEKPGQFVGGHAMYVLGYTRTGPVFLTWGQRQVATWEWFLARCDELYGVVDDRNRFMDSGLDVDRLNIILKEVTK